MTPDTSELRRLREENESLHRAFDHMDERYTDALGMWMDRGAEIAALRERVGELEARVRELEDGLRKLVNEVTGILAFAEEDLRIGAGHTNVLCLTTRLDASRALLAPPEEPASPEPPACATCGGEGTIDQTLGAGRGHIVEPHPPCPDCEGGRP